MSDLGSLLNDLGDAFPRDKRSIETWRLYQRMLGHLPFEILEQAIHELICTQTFHVVPTIGEIRRCVAEHQLALPGEADALGQLEARMEWARTHDGDRPDVHPLVAAALDHVGGFPALRNAEQPTIVRGQFLKLYREAREQAIRGHQTSAAQLQVAPELLALPPGGAEAIRRVS